MLFMKLKRIKKQSVLQLTVLLLSVAFAIVIGACSSEITSGQEIIGGGEESNLVGPNPAPVLPQEINYVQTLNWGVSTVNAPSYLTLTPGKTEKEVNLTWTGTGSVSKIRFIRGTLTAGKELIEVAGSVPSSNLHKATVTGLKSGESYEYAVSSDDTNWSTAYSFKVAPDGAFKFAVITDPQLNTGNDGNGRYKAANPAAGWAETVGILVNKGVSFIASNGDQTDTAGSDTQFTSLYAPAGIKSLPFAPTMGNHDTSTVFFNRTNITTETGTANSTSLGANYYYLYNNVLMVVLNTSFGPSSKSAAATYITAFSKAIKDAKAAHAGKYDWLIVQHHKSTASVATHAADKDIQYYVEAGFETLMSDEGVDFVLAGHDHVYARSYPLQGKKDGQVSVPDTTKGGNQINNPGNPIYITLTSSSGQKYYQFPFDKEWPKVNVSVSNADYPYLGEVTGGGTGSTAKGSTSYNTGNYKPVSTAVAAQPFIPSYTIVEVNGKTIKFSTYTIASASGRSAGASQDFNYDKDTPYDWVEVTKN
jgi:3',5'-cyclic AMP phosphodiesterase CpdA